MSSWWETGIRHHDYHAEDAEIPEEGGCDELVSGWDEMKHDSCGFEGEFGLVNHGCNGVFSCSKLGMRALTRNFSLTGWRMKRRFWVVAFPGEISGTSVRRWGGRDWINKVQL